MCDNHEEHEGHEEYQIIRDEACVTIRKSTELPEAERNKSERQGASRRSARQCVIWQFTDG